MDHLQLLCAPSRGDGWRILINVGLDFGLIIFGFAKRKSILRQNMVGVGVRVGIRVEVETLAMARIDIVFKKNLFGGLLARLLLVERHHFTMCNPLNVAFLALKINIFIYLGVLLLLIIYEPVYLLVLREFA